MPLPAVPPGTNAYDTVPDIRHDYLVRGKSPELVLGQKDSYGVLYWWEDLDGWWSTPPMDTPITALGNADRSVGGQRFPRKEKQITIHGVCHFNHPDDGFAARERLVRYWDSPNDPFDLVVEEPNPKRMTVRSSGPIEAPWDITQRSFAFQIPLVALDPFKYSLIRAVNATSPSQPGSYTRTYIRTYPMTYVAEAEGSGLISVVNAGNADTYPTMLVQGAVPPGWRIVNYTTDETLTVATRVNAGQTLQLDMKSHNASFSNATISVQAGGDWIRLVPGENIIKFVTPSEAPDALLTVISYDAYK